MRPHWPTFIEALFVDLVGFLLALLLALSLSCATVPTAPPAPRYTPADIALVSWGAGFWLGLSAVATAAFLAVAFYGDDEACTKALNLSFLYRGQGQPPARIDPIHVKPSRGAE